MLKIAGMVIDVHDDSDLRVLREAMPLETVRDKYAGRLELLDEEELGTLPESRLGAIFFNSHSSEIEKRAYPLHTPEHAELSALYFEKCASSFPEDARNQIASQIRQGLAMHGLDGSESLEKWASAYGDWQPGDNFIDIALLSSPPPPEREAFAFSKSAGEHTQFILPCGTAEETSDSIRALTREDGPDDLGLTRIEAKNAASALKYASEQHGIEPPPALLKMACVDEREEIEVQALLRDRLSRVSEDLDAPHRKLANDTIKKIADGREAEKRAGLLEAFDAAFGIGERAYGRGAPRPFDVFYVEAQVKRASADDVLTKLGGMDRIKRILGEKRAAAFETDPHAALAAVKPELRVILEHGGD